MPAAKSNNNTQKIFDSISKAYHWLGQEGRRNAHWDEVRSTALAGLCLAQLEPPGSVWVKRVREWLLEQQKPQGKDMGSWGEEIWDTSLALLALKRLGTTYKKRKIQKALNWTRSLYDRNKRKNWHDEYWETSLAIMALSQFGASSESPDATGKDLEEIVMGACNWLIESQDNNGRICSPHYTAFLLLVARELENLDRFRTNRPLEAYVRKAAEYLQPGERWVAFNEILWTGEPWSNGLILWALSSTKNFPQNDPDVVGRVVNWFVKEQEDMGAWDDVEDTCYAILGLSHLVKFLEGMDDSELRHRLHYDCKLRRPLPKGKPWDTDPETGDTTILLRKEWKPIAASLLAAFAVVKFVYELRDLIWRALHDFLRMVLGQQ